MLETLTALLGLYRLPAAFAGAFFFGDSVILTTAYLAGQQHWSPVPIFLAMFLGTAVADTLWFFAGVVMTKWSANMSFMRNEREKAAVLLQKLMGKNPMYALIFIKFLYGSRIAMILYTAARGFSFRVFSFYNSIGILAWLVVFFPLGYLGGMGIGVVLPPSSTIQAAVAVLITSVILMRIFTIWLTKRVTKE